ncbi:MAG TPA: hypothetical protein VEB39_07115 [Sphingomicrobium sp.]|nr:hypothetical protein [Sphingomicrobium sp.]
MSLVSGDDEQISPELERLFALYSSQLPWSDRLILRWRGSRWQKNLPKLPLREKLFVGTTSSVIERVVGDRRNDPDLSAYDLDELGKQFLQMCAMRYFVRPNITLAFFSLSLLHRNRPEAATAQEYVDLYHFVQRLWVREEVIRWKQMSS